MSREDKLLKLIFDLGGEASRKQINKKLPEYWELDDSDNEIEEGVGKPRYWHRSASVCQILKDRKGYLENPTRGIWRITEKGRKYLDSIGHQSAIEIHQSLPQGTKGDLPLCKKLLESQRDSQNPVIFEKALVEAFNALGFNVKHIGGRDEPDVLIENYKIILDAKTTKEGVISENYVNFNALKRYKETYGIKYIGVIAPGFSSGNIQGTAKRENIKLIETDALCMLLQNHTIYPYETSRIIDILFLPDKAIITSNDIPSSTIDQEKLVEITSKILSDIKLTNKFSFTSRELFSAYSWQNLNYEPDEIERALEFLSTVPFNILQKRDNEYSLTSDIKIILKKIGLLLEAFNKIGR